MRRWLVFFSPQYAKTLVYMVQSTEYQPGKYLSWWWRTQDFSIVMYRRSLDFTRAARLLLAALYTGITLYFLFAGWLIYAGYAVWSVVLILAYPVIWGHLLVVPIWLGRIFISGPIEARSIRKSEKIFAKQALRSAIIAIVGSYGKTSMKELLSTILSTKLKVAATPANYNVAISHAHFAQTLAGDEDVVIVEYGEGAPGDVTKFAYVTHPTHAIITGIAPAHLDRYKTLDAAADDIFSVSNFVPKEHVFVNKDSAYVNHYAKENFLGYDHKQTLGWKIRNRSVSVDGTRFTMHRGSITIKIQSGLLGEHNVGPLACAAALAFDFGMSVPQIEEAINMTKPHEHRMQPYQLSGAWIIDDTYNGNIEGIRAGTSLLATLPASRKIYVTPGLVDQGDETEAVHIEMGRLIAIAKPQLVVLMRNSVTEYILQGLTEAGFGGDTQVQDDPLDYYQNLSHFVATGDLVLMQNDWTDNYH